MGPAMPEAFPRTSSPSGAARVGVIAVGLAALALAARTTVTSSRWVGQAFPGFMLLDNRVVASASLAHWSGATVPGLFQQEVVAVDGVPVRSAVEVYAHVRALPAGSAVRYRLAAGREETIASQRFTVRDWLLLFGVYLVNGAICLGAALVVWILRPRAPLARALLAVGVAVAVFLWTAMDVYGPATYFRVHVAAEVLMAAALLNLALLFPQPHPWAAWRAAAYGLAVAILVPYELLLYRPGPYSATLTVSVVFLGLAGLVFAVRLVSGYWRGRSQLARQRVRVVTLGTLFGFGLPAAILLVSALTLGGLAMNLVALAPGLFALSFAYAIVQQDLFEIDAMVRRGAYYLLLTGAVGAAYIAAVLVFNLSLQAGAIADSPAFPLFFTLAVLLLFNPLRSRLQALVDRVFFRTRYDGAEVLGTVGRELTGTLRLDQIAALIRDCVDRTIPNGRTRLFVASPPAPGLREVGGAGEVPPALLTRLAEGRVVTGFDSPEIYPDAPAHEAALAGMATLEAAIAVPLQLRGELVGVLTAGPKRSGLFYGAGDVAFLRAMANQVAIALENARTYEALALLNARLEERVRERTSQLEATHRELGDAYAELKTAQSQLVHSEKMASLGRLVAGVAHEINNPVSFIATSVGPLLRRLGEAAACAPAEVAPLLREAEDIVGIMARGAERTSGIVKDLRSFSRLGQATRKAADLHESLEVSLRLLDSRWRDRIAVHRDYGTLPPIECDPGQLNQVFMNVLTNACDAIADRGNIWIATRAEGSEVLVTIRDDGAGIAPEVLGRIFDPFFSTKDVGGGTGLGLAVSHSVVAAHGGRIEVESTPGAGATFRIVLPVGVAGLSLDRLASSGR